MTQNRFYSSVGLPSTLAAAITSSIQSPISVNSITGNPTSFPYTLLIDWGLPTQEAVSVTASTGTGPFSLTVTRGIDGTTAQTHVNGAVVVHGVTAEDYNEPQVHISTGTSSGSYPGVIHGLQAGSSVVGTTDTQTLTNKTLGATTLSGATTMSVNSATGLLVSVTNTHSTPSNPNIEWIAAGVADSVVGIQVSGDTVQRFQVNSAGKIQWGPGGSSAVDTDLYRSAANSLTTDGNLTVGLTFTANAVVVSEASASGKIIQITNTTGAPTAANVLVTSNSSTDNALGLSVSGDTVNRLSVLASGKMNWGPGGATSADTDLYRNAVGELKTDQSITAAANLTIGGSQLLAGGTGVLGINNASVAPSTTPSGGSVAYSKSGYLKYRGADGLDYNTGSLFLFLAAPATSITTGYGTVTGLSTTIGIGTYKFEAWLLFSQVATVGTVAFAVNGPTTSVLAYSVEQLLGTTLTEANATAYNSGPTSGTLTASTTYLARITGLLTSTASGAFAVTKNASATGTFSVLAGSYFEIKPIA